MEHERRASLSFLGGAVALLVAVGVAVQLDHEETIVTAALWSLGLAALARRLPHQGPAWVAVAASAVATLGLCANSVASGHYLRSEGWLFNTLAYVHLVPAAALIGVTLLLQGIDPGERVGRRLRLALAVVPGLGAILVLFVYINLSILNAFAQGDYLRVEIERVPARDLTMSLAWGVYALLLLSLGTMKRVMALRWASLSLFLLAVGKVFLHDLGHLEGLYRVGSLAGLAVSLLAVSLFYQRFVFRGSLDRSPKTEGTPA